MQICKLLLFAVADADLFICPSERIQRAADYPNHPTAPICSEPANRYLLKAAVCCSCICMQPYIYWNLAVFIVYAVAVQPCSCMLYLLNYC